MLRHRIQSGLLLAAALLSAIFLAGGWTVFAGINNAFNRQRDFASASDFGPIAGRFVYVGAKWAFGAHQR